MENVCCPDCKSKHVWRRSVRQTLTGLKREYRCSKCKRIFRTPSAFKRFRHSPEVITCALDLRAKGLSLADVTDHLHQFYKVDVTRKTILDWEQRFAEKIEGFTQSLNPHCSKQVSADEMFFKAGGKQHYNWNAIDRNTKFLIAEHISTKISADEALNFAKLLKPFSSLDEKIHITTDGLHEYVKAFKKGIGSRRIKHIRYPQTKTKNKFKNNPVERLHNTKKQRYKTMRCYDNFESAKKNLLFLRVYYNFLRKHTTLDWKTPAQAAGIELQLGRNRWLSILNKTINFLLSKLRATMKLQKSFVWF